MENKTTKPSDGSNSAVNQNNKAYNQVLTVGEVERLYKLDPAFAKFIVDQTERESRRAFIDKLAGQFFALFVGLSGLAVGGFLVYTRPEVAIAGAAIAVASVYGLAVTFVRGRG